jgi:hypothetical protein
MSWEKYNLNFTPRWYNTDISADLLPSVTSGQWLVKWTQNVLIDEDGSISSRKGLTMLGDTGWSGWVQWSDTWTTNTNSDRPMRTVFDRLQVFYENEWHDVKAGFGNNINFCGGSWWDRDQSMDRYIWVNKTTNMYSWQGGITRVASRVSSTSLKKENGGTPISKTIAIVSGNTVSWWFPLNVTNPTSRNSLVGTNWFGNFWDAGFRAGDSITLTFTGIAGSYTIASVDATNNEILITGTFGASGSSTAVGESITGTVNAYWPLAKTFAQERFGTPQLLGTTTMTIASPCVVTYTAHGLKAWDTVYFETTGALPTNLVVNTQYYVISTGLTANTFQLSTTRGGSAINTSGGQSGVHTLYKTTQMNFTMLGVSYTYTGWFNTDTLTGIVPNLPATIDADTIIMSDVLTHTPSGGDYSTGATPSILTVSVNQAWLGDTDRNWVWFSNQSDFTNFTYTVPVRTNGEGGSARLDKNINAIIPNNQDNSIRVSAGRDTWYPISLASVTSNWVAGEEVRVGTPVRWSWVWANNQFSVCNTKQGVVYLSQEPTFDYLQNVEQNNQVITPIWDDVSADFVQLDMTGSKTLYWQKHVWLLIPNAGLLYGYDMNRKLWQPPQTVAGNCMSIIDEQLIIHSSVRQESYIMFSGTNDNWYPISFVVRPNYVNGGTRERFKTLDGYFAEVKATSGTDNITFSALFWYKGSKGRYDFTFGAGDGSPFVDEPDLTGGFGQSSIGQMPIGSLYTDEDTVQFRKVRRIFPFVKNNSEFFEMQVQFSCDKLDSQFKIIAHGDNMQLSSSQNSLLIKI